MPEATLKVSTGFLEAMLLPPDTLIRDMRVVGRHVELVVEGPAVPEGCKYVHSVRSQATTLVAGGE